MWSKIKSFYNQWLKPVEEGVVTIIAAPFLLCAIIMLTVVKLALYRTNYINIDIKLSINDEIEPS